MIMVELSMPPIAGLALPAHEHAWELRGVDFTDGVSVQEFACHDCSEVWFR